MNRFNLKVFKRFWQLVKPYWFSNEKYGAITILILLLLLTLAYTFISVSITRFQGDLISALSKLDRERFIRTIWSFLAVLAVYVPVYSFSVYFQDKLSNYWRKWLTYDFLSRYFGNRAFYEVGNFNTQVDNPDQRIAEDIKSFTAESLNFLLVIFNAIFQMIGYTALLWNIPPKVTIFEFANPIKISKLEITKIAPSILIIFLFAYFIIGTLITIGIFGRKLVDINYEQLRKEANFRFGLVRIRENSESIAFYRGERQESRNLKKFFTEVFDNFNSLIFWQDLLLSLFSKTYEYFPFVLPAVVIAPSVFAGDTEVGKVREAQVAFGQFFMSINIIVYRFQFWTAFVAGIDRLYLLKEYLDRTAKKYDQVSQEQPIINTVQQDRLSIDRLTLQTPNYQRTLIKNLSLNLPTGDGLLIMGTSGCGKSSLLRAIAGLWNSGTGSIYRPDLSEILFLPQKPYMILGTLRSQLIYPHDDLQVSDLDLYYALDVVNLPDLAERFGGFDVEKDWEEVLSLGEQQRLAFARIILSKPSYVILDEATSALDIKNEASLYQHLLKTQTTFVSVGHRPSLVQYHNWILEIGENQQWKLESASNFAPNN
jgi:vitamin B12/bleomycin/antimicrobial peptide transport system ATP-binding/permease protein